MTIKFLREIYHLEKKNTLEKFLCKDEILENFLSTKTLCFDSLPIETKREKISGLVDGGTCGVD